eukprot:g1722.t1
MPQGAYKKSNRPHAKAARKRSKPYSNKRCSTANTKKGSPGIARQATAFHKFRSSNKKMTSMINRNIEEVMAGRAVQNGQVLRCGDLLSTGKSKWKEVKVGALKKNTKQHKFQERMQKKIDKLGKQGKELE